MIDTPPQAAVAGLTLDIQHASEARIIPTQASLTAWATAALNGHRDHAEMTIRIVDEAEGAELNLTYRGKRGPTNVLSFPFYPPPGIGDLELIGDLVICAPVVEREAFEQGKDSAAHWAHMVVHGTLHLLGYDHLTEGQAAEMEALETDILLGLGFSAPYEYTSRGQV